MSEQTDPSKACTEKEVLNAEIYHAIESAKKLPKSREISLVITNLQQAKLWLKEEIEVNGK